MGGTDVSPPERPMQSLTLAQLKAEKLKLERHILELPNDGFVALREQLEESLVATTREIQCRKPAGQTLDQALARHKMAIRAKTAAEEHLAQAEASLLRAKTALQQATENETMASQEVTRVKAAIAEEDGPDNSKATVPPEIMGAVYQILQNAGLHASQLAAVARTLGSPLPPCPPTPPAEAPPVAAMAGVNPQEVQQATPMPPALQGLQHPRNLASQLLGATAVAGDGALATARPRPGRSPIPARKLPPRGGEADKASTYQASPSRSASRTPGQGRTPCQARSTSNHATQRDSLPDPPHVTEARIVQPRGSCAAPDIGHLDLHRRLAACSASAGLALRAKYLCFPFFVLGQSAPPASGFLFCAVPDEIWLADCTSMYISCTYSFCLLEICHFGAHRL